MSSHVYLSDEETRAALVADMPDNDKALWYNMRFVRLVACFKDRLFVVYKHKKVPEILDTIVVDGLRINEVVDTEMSIVLRSKETGHSMATTFVPQRLFDYDLCVLSPTRCSMELTARIVDRKDIAYSMTYTMLVKSQGDPRRKPFNHTCMVPFNEFCKIFPDQNYKIADFWVD